MINFIHLKKAILTVVFLIAVSAGVFSQKAHPEFLDGRIYFKIKSGYSLPYSKENGFIHLKNVTFLRELIDKYEIKSVRNSFYTAKSPVIERIFLLRFNKIYQADELINDLLQTDCIEYAEKAPLFKITYTPNDYGTTAGNNWHLAKINAQGAWDITHGSASIKVAVIDNAIYANHPELINKIVAKIDLANNDDDPTPPMMSTNYLSADWAWSHGTHTTGLVGAQTDNNTGITSIGFNVSLIAIKAADDSTQNMTGGLEGIIWAADTGARVINMSWGGFQYIQAMQEIVNYAYNKGCVLVASAGNNGNGLMDSTNTNTVMYPAACEHVISVGSTNGNDIASSFSEYGTWLDVMAPGGWQNDGGLLDQLLNYGVYSTVYTSTSGGFGKMEGTSMASPITAGLCGLMISINPNITPDEVTTLLKSTCVNIESLQDALHQGKVGSGRINAQAAVQAAQNAISAVNANFSTNTTVITEGGSVTFTDLSSGTPTSWQWTFNGGTPSSYNGQNPPVITYNTQGSYSVTLAISDGTNNDTETKNAFIIVNAPPAPSAWIVQAAGFVPLYRGAYQITIASPSVVWATGIDGTNGTPVNEFTKTTNGGNTWAPDTIVGPPAVWRISNLASTSADKAWIAMYNSGGAGGRIYVTQDGGITWTLQTTAVFNTSSGFPNVVHFFNDSAGFTMGDPANSEFEIFTTGNGGNTWTVVPVANIPNAVSGEMGWTNVYDVIGNTIWFGTNKGRVFKSTDRGLNWTVTDAGMGDCQKVTFSDENNGIVQKITYSSGIVTAFVTKVTHDGGTTWAAVNPVGPIWKGDISAVPGVPGRYISVGSNGAASGSAHYGSSYSLDYGATWTAIDTAVQYISTKFYDEFTGWASGFCTSPIQGGMYKWSPGIVNTKPIFANDETISIYPNPSKGLIHIKSSGNKEMIIKVYNVIGKIIYSTALDIKNQASLDFSSFDKGIYFAVIQTGTRITSKKIIIE
ncbi:MAG: S8 family serine peptidase [Bacteroidia bacterium]|nr:S8 family serine peptidase [Bacteroidia bacterium]